MNEERKNTYPVNKAQAAFNILLCILACTNLISMVYDKKAFAETGFYRIVLMSLMTVASIIVTPSVFVLYFKKIFYMRALKVRYFVVCLCCISICFAVVWRGLPYIKDIKEGTSVVVTDDYWYYMGSGDIEFTDPNGNKQVVSANHLGEMEMSLTITQFFSVNNSENKKSIYIEYYPNSGTVADIHMIK